MMRCLFVGIKHSDAGLQEKTAQDGFVARPLATHSKSGAQFSAYDEWQPDLIGAFNRLYHRYIPPAKVFVAIRVERQPHRHISSSMVCCASTAVSEAGSLRQVPAISLRSRSRPRSPLTPVPRARASIATSFRLLSCSRAARRRASSKVFGTLRIVYCMHIL